MSSSTAGTIALAVDMGGTKVEAAAVDDSGTVVGGTRFRAPTGPGRSSEELAASVTSVVDQAIAALPPGANLAGVGIGSAGPVSEADGRVSPLNLPVWRGFPLRELVASRVNVPVALRMDGICIALAEHWVGAARGYANVMGMIVSTGIGGGLILHGNTVSGPTGNAGHIGHVEAIASGPMTVAWARRQGWQGSTGEELSASFAAGDPIAAAAVERSGRA